MDAVTAAADGRSVTVSTWANGPLTSQLVGLHGWQRASSSIAPGGTAYDGWALVPELVSEANSGLYVALASLTADDPASEGVSAEEMAASVSVDVGGARVRIGWPDGRPDTELDLDDIATRGPESK